MVEHRLRENIFYHYIDDTFREISFHNVNQIFWLLRFSLFCSVEERITLSSIRGSFDEFMCSASKAFEIRLYSQLYYMIITSSRVIKGTLRINLIRIAFAPIYHLLIVFKYTPFVGVTKISFSSVELPCRFGKVIYSDMAFPLPRSSTIAFGGEYYEKMSEKE